MSIPKFIDTDNADTFGDEPGFLIQTTREGVDRWALRTKPARKNGSGEEVLSGWCGETNNVDCWARGLAMVVRKLGNGRSEIASVPEDKARWALERLGYPELG